MVIVRKVKVNYDYGNGMGYEGGEKSLYLNKTKNINNEHTETKMNFYSSVTAWIHFAPSYFLINILYK